MTGTSYMEAIDGWRRNYERGLTAPDSWLAIVGLDWLQEGANEFGTQTDNPVVLPEGATAPRAGRFILHEDTVTLEADPEVPVLMGQQRVSSQVIPVDKSNSSESITVGRLTLYVIRRGTQYAIRTYDPENPARHTFPGVEWFPIDERYRIQAHFTPFDTPQRILVDNILGMTEESISTGLVSFTLHGQDFQLQPVLSSGQDRLFFMFRDATSGKQTYPAGRYLYTALPQDGLVEIDFNKAYSPPCAFTPYATCTLPPRQNHLPIPILTGAKYHH